MAEQTCPCCGSILLRHMRNSGPYWMCTSCWQEMPASAEPSAPNSESNATLNQEVLAALDGLENLDSLQQRLRTSITSTDPIPKESRPLI